MMAGNAGHRLLSTGNSVPQCGKWLC